MSEIPEFKPNPKFAKLRESGLFRNDSAAAYALNAYENLKKPVCESLIVAATGKSYNWVTVPCYLVDCCGVQPENIEKALVLLEEASE